MKKYIAILMAVAIALSMTACGGEAAPAETTAPPVTETLSACEANGHSWADATCDMAKTCSVCGEAEGEALGHSWVEANFQTPKTCSLCGVTEGEAMTAAFEEHGLAINITELDTEYDYVTTCATDPTKKTVGKLTVSGYRVFEEDENHPALEGYEWHGVSVTIRFNDENAWNYGMGVNTCQENYYDIIGWDESSAVLEEEQLVRYTCNFNGVEYTECLYDDSCFMNFSEWKNKECVCTFERYFRVPVGFDGGVIGFFDYGTEWADGQHIFDIADENTLFFRLDGTGAEKAE